MLNLYEQIGKIRIIPVITLNDASRTLALAQTLINAGLPCAEIALRTATAEEAIQKISKVYLEMILGAGTVLNVEQAKCALNAWAKFIVSPGYSTKLVI